MHFPRLSVLVFASALSGAFFACGTSAPKCSPVSCAGCCTEAGACVDGKVQTECGSQGNACASCGAGTACEFGICRGASTGGGSGAVTGGGAGGGGGGSATGGGTGTGGGSATGGGAGGAAGGGGGATGGGGGSRPDAGPVILDAGTPGVDGGTLFPPTVPLTFMATCGPVAPCAGNEIGNWMYSAGCIDNSAFTLLSGLVAQLGCTSTISGKNGAIAGAVVFDGTNVHRNVVGLVNFHFAAVGQTCVALCSNVSGQLPAGMTGTCAATGSACECDLSFDLSDNLTQPYTYTGGMLATATSMEQYNTCITGPSLAYRETTDGGIPGVFTLDHP